ncbi:MAG: peptide chain release factor N(5)-glutamine methyltransferase [Dysgonamonadaceae bacterium]
MLNYLEYIQNSIKNIYQEAECFSLSRILIEEVSGTQAALFLSDKNTQLNIDQKQRLDDILKELSQGKPLQYILGYTEFYGLRFEVNSDVLIPRPETEELVEWIVSCPLPEKCRILDIGTGSGCIAVTLAKLLPDASIEAWDISEKALAVAKNNADKAGVDICFRQLDILNAFLSERSCFDIIVSNPPYIMNVEKKEMHTNVLDFEPHLALFVDDSDPLVFYRSIAKAGQSLLKPGGRLFYEINAQKGKETVALLDEMGYTDVTLRQDLSGNDRMILALHK